MIPIGTVCYLTGDHSRAGQCCTVVGPVFYATEDSNAAGRAGYFYPIALASGERPWDIPPHASMWAASSWQLIPIAPPGLTTDEDKRIPVAA